ASTTGGYARYEWDVTNLVRDGDNTIALRFQKDNASNYLTTDTVDWNQPAPDGLTGAQFPIQLRTTKAVELDDVHVLQSDAADFSSADLTVKATLKNTTNAAQAVDLGGAITQSQDSGSRGFDTDVVLNPGETRTVKFTPDAYPALHVADPHVWWPYDMGDQQIGRASCRERV